MNRLKFLTVMTLLLTVVVLPRGDGRALAQSGSTGEKRAVTAEDRIKARIERMQQRRKARISHADRQAAAERAKAARAGKAAQIKAGKGVSP